MFPQETDQTLLTAVVFAECHRAYQGAARGSKGRIGRLAHFFHDSGGTGQMQ
jgi:hypothetical protein